MLGYLWIDQLAPMCLQPRKRSFLVRSYEPAITGHIGGENSGQPTFDAFSGQTGTPRPHGPNTNYRLWKRHSNGKRERWYFLFGGWALFPLSSISRVDRLRSYYLVLGQRVIVVQSHIDHRLG